MNEGTYSFDLRKRVIEFVKEGGSKRQACKTYRIGHNTIYRWLRDFKKNKSYLPKRRKEFYRKCDLEKLQKYNQKNPEATLIEAAEHLRVSHVTIWRSFRQLKITRKKKQRIQRAK